MRSTISVVVFAYMIQLVLGDVSVAKPEFGDKYVPQSNGRVEIEVVWKENGYPPTLDEVTFYSINLLYGSNSEISLVKKLAEEVPGSSIIESDEGEFKYTVDFSQRDVGNGQFFIQIYAYASDYGYTIHYSERFTIASIVGGATTFTVSELSPPQPEYGITAHKTIDSKSFSIPYYLQTGKSRFAPMQPLAGSTITATSWRRQFPTSAASYYSTARKKIDQVTTITPGWSYILTSDHNYATPAPFPKDNGGWYHPMQRQTHLTRKTNIGAY